MRYRPSPSSALWITDDVLADAFNRVLRVSLSHNTTGAWRRHGSHVPGPLEAHRRLAKRRMGGAAAMMERGAAVPWAGDFGALFGFGARKSPARADGWQWEAPRAGPPPPPPPLVVVGVAVEEPLIRSKTPGEVAREMQAKAVETSKATFLALLPADDSTTTTTTLDEAALRPALDFLLTTHDEPDARNTLRLVKWLDTRTPSVEALSAVLNLVHTKLQLRVLSVPTLRNFVPLLFARRDGKDVERVLALVLDNIPIENMRNVINEVTSNMRVSARETEVDPGLERVKSWLRILGRCKHMQGVRHHESLLWSRVYKHLGKQFEPADFPEHFATLHAESLARVLLEHWVPYMAVAEPPPPDMTIRPDSKKMRFPRSSRLTLELIQDLTEQYAALRTARYTANSTLKRDLPSPLTDLILILARANLPTTHVLTAVFALLIQTSTPSTLHRTLLSLHNLRLGIPPTLASTFITHHLSLNTTASLRRAYATLLLVVPTLSIPTSHPSLLLRLIARGLLTPPAFFALLNRQPHPDRLPPSQRTAHTIRTTLTAAHIRLVDLAAYAFASSPRITSRAAFRRVWECKRFLQDRGVRASPLMARAVVRAGLARPMREKGGVALGQVRWAVRVVEAVEGEESARGVDRGVWEGHVRAVREGRGRRIERQKGGGGGGGGAVMGGRGRRNWARRRERVEPQGKEREVRMIGRGEAEGGEEGGGGLEGLVETAPWTTTRNQRADDEDVGSAIRLS